MRKKIRKDEEHLAEFSALKIEAVLCRERQLRELMIS